MHDSSRTRPGWAWLLFAICVLMVVLWFLSNSTRNRQAAEANLGEAREGDREAHKWPAQKLLDYGQTILGSLRPGMVYVGGTDPGCFIPTFLNETSEGERHVVMTQNALADGSYLDYLNFVYKDRMNTLG